MLTLSSEVRVRVDETPRFHRATSFASMDTPGPFEMKATDKRKIPSGFGPLHSFECRIICKLLIMLMLLQDRQLS